MPGIGRPNSSHNFGHIGKYERSGKNINKGKNHRKMSLGDELNELAGVKRKQKFVDRNKHNKLDKNAFLKLLSSQLQNQDPFKPVDQKKFAADMAQFAQLEQLTNMNTKLDKSTSGAENREKFMGASFIGKAVHTRGTSVSYDGESRFTNLPFYLKKPAMKVMVRIFDSSHNLIAQVEKDSMGMGANSITWDGLQMDGAVAVKGNYTFDVKAWDDEYQFFPGETKAQGVVTGVDFENGETVLTVDGKKKVALRDVESFFLPKWSKDGGQNIHQAKNNQKKQVLKKDIDAAYNSLR